MRVDDLCNRTVIVISKDATIRQAAERMREHHVGALVVVTDERVRAPRPLGLLTDRDLGVSVLAQAPDDVARLLVGDVMTSDLLTAQEGELVTDVLVRMRERGVRRAPVVDADGVLAGIFALDDVIGLLSDLLQDISAIVYGQPFKERERRG